MRPLWFDMVSLAAESQRVMWLRLLRLSAGGPRAAAEIERMVFEKASAAAGAVATLMSGGSARGVVRGYRRKVRSNRRRLSRRF
jgi:hypothetical protein